MKKTFLWVSLAFGLTFPLAVQAQESPAPAAAPSLVSETVQAVAPETAPPPAAPLTKARLFAVLPKEFCVTPDTFCHAPWGDMLLSCPNYADPAMPRIILSINEQNDVRLWGVFPSNPAYSISTEPGKLSAQSGPMGMEFGPDGNLYVVDNPGWYADPFSADENFPYGRVLRILVKDKRPVGAEVVAFNLTHPNDVKIRDGWIYVSHSMLAKEGDTIVSAVYRFPLDARNVKVGNTVNDPEIIALFRTTKIPYGIDGICFGNNGELYVGNFGEGTIDKITFDKDGKASQPEPFAQGPEMLTNDGLFYDKENGHIYVCDFSRNAILDVDENGKIRVIAQNGDTDGLDGSIDQPAGVILRGKQLIISNFDNVPGPPHVNTGHDEYCTLSVIDLEGIIK